MNKSLFQHTIKACLDNGGRLLSDAQMLEFSEPPATAFALIIIAQEEFAKAFLLTLVDKDIIPWNEFIWRAARDHTCKHLLAMVMDYLNPDWEDFRARMDGLREGRIAWTLPRHIADAINILRHEKIGKWESKNWFWVDPPDYDLRAKKIATGTVDRMKQDQIYVDINKSGSVIAKAVITQEQFKDEMDRARRLAQVVRSMIEDDKTAGLDYEEVTKAFQLLFANMALDSDKGK